MICYKPNHNANECGFPIQKPYRFAHKNKQAKPNDGSASAYAGATIFAYDATNLTNS